MTSCRRLLPKKEWSRRAITIKTMKTMKQLFLLLFLLGTITTANAEGVSTAKDKNDFDFLTDKEFNNEYYVVVLNDGTLVKSLIGFNMDSVSMEQTNFVGQFPFVIRDIHQHGDSLIVSKDPKDSPLQINGRTYKRIFRINYPNNCHLISLDDIRKTYFPQTEDAPCMYMVNKFFLMNDLASYKFDKDFILKVEMLESTDFDAFKQAPLFHIIRIFTKTRENLKNQRASMRLR